MKPTAKQDTPELNSEAVGAYLMAHPEFFEHNPKWLSKLQLRHDSGSAISLIEYQVAELRKQNARLERQLQEFIEVARDNQRLVDHMQHLAQALMECHSLQDVIDTIYDELREQFSIEFIAINAIEGGDLAGQAQAIGSISREQQRSFFADFIHYRQPQCARLPVEQLAIFFKENADQIQSQALVPICGAEDLAILALGSSDAGRFHPGMGIFYLQQLSSLISRAVIKHLS